MTGLAPADRRLVDAVIGGDRDAFRELVEREAGMVIATCHRILRHPAEAQDAAQETFLQAYRMLGSFRGEGPFGAWVRRIAVRISLARLAARVEAVSLDAESLDPRAAALASDDDLEASALQAEWRGAVLDAVAGLPSTQRQVIVMRFYEDRSLAEIAALTGQPLGTVKSRLHRGLAGLRHGITSEGIR